MVLKSRSAMSLFACFMFLFGQGFLSLSHAEEIHGTAANDDIIVTPATDCDGIIAYAGDDTVTVSAGAEVSAVSNDAYDSSADAAATAIDTGTGNDSVQNNGTVSADAGTEVYAADVSGDASGIISLDASAASTATATGIDAGGDSDTVFSTNPITALATALAEVVNIGLQLADATVVMAGVEAQATAVGIDAGDSGTEDPDEANTIVSTGPITATATSTAAPSIANIQMYDFATASAQHESTATALGILGGGGADGITTSGPIEATASSTGDSISVEGNLVDAGVADSGIETTATATALSGLAGSDLISNTGTLTASATANAEDISIN
ncbi:MAG TPA: hypothetical protein ENO14_02350, partial [Chromatiales bacterium]|nr:hypothetical protein [Chromatiales bacterium]